MKTVKEGIPVDQVYFECENFFFTWKIWGKLQQPSYLNVGPKIKAKQVLFEIMMHPDHNITSNFKFHAAFVFDSFVILPCLVPGDIRQDNIVYINIFHFVLK